MPEYCPYVTGNMTLKEKCIHTKPETRLVEVKLEFSTLQSSGSLLQRQQAGQHHSHS
jgi:hypothetical protein